MLRARNGAKDPKKGHGADSSSQSSRGKEYTFPCEKEGCRIIKATLPSHVSFSAVLRQFLPVR